jgi:hypothetical protein
MLKFGENEPDKVKAICTAAQAKVRGTWDTIYLAWKKGIPVYVFPIR